MWRRSKTHLVVEPELVHARFRGEAWKPEHWFDPNTKSQAEPPEEFLFTNTAIHVAAVNGQNEMLELLLDSDAHPDEIGFEANKGLTPPLVLATWEGTLDTVQILLDYGA